MSFSEAVKLEAKQKAAFQCCVCRQVVVGLEVHHITPEEFNGSDDIENAAALCPNCHKAYGNDPKIRKEIKQRRDWWYEQVKKMYPPQGFGPGIYQKLEDITDRLNGLPSGLSSIEEVKSSLKELSNAAIDRITPANANATASTLINTFIPTTSGGSPYVSLSFQKKNGEVETIEDVRSIVVKENSDLVSINLHPEGMAIVPKHLLRNFTVKFSKD